MQYHQVKNSWLFDWRGHTVLHIVNLPSHKFWGGDAMKWKLVWFILLLLNKYTIEVVICIIILIEIVI